jgi:hypothetical protein
VLVYIAAAQKLAQHLNCWALLHAGFILQNVAPFGRGSYLLIPTSFSVGKTQKVLFYSSLRQIKASQANQSADHSQADSH